ncbi:hypothetical protein N665_0172s0030 [Sinapis alba]|nr:hypothetical protein N665_0172s0030 [Sinapis alba]
MGDLNDIMGNQEKEGGILRYDNRWRLQPEVRRVINEVWNKECADLPPAKFHQVIKRLRNALSRWRSKQKLNSQKEIQRIKQEIQGVYEKDCIDYDHLNSLKLLLQMYYRMEEEYWRTKSRVLWLQAGDKNTRFFHAKTKQRRNFNRIIHIQDEAGTHYSKNEDIQNHIVSPITENEVRAAVFSINPDKSPGPDGMNAGFYRHHWNTIKKENGILREMEKLDTEMH